MSSPQRHPGSIDFEPTDLSEARKVLEELPEGLAEAASISQGWTDRRRKLTPADRALTGATIDWLVALPSAVRPTALCNQYPRIANTLAEAWADRNRILEIFRLLHSDQRGRRQGFAPNVQLEIARLRAYRSGQK
jgi:hypothetical protein